MEDKPWIGVDLDGTLAYYDGWRGIEHIGEPIEPMRHKVLEMIRGNYRIKIFTARARDTEAIKHIEEWCIKHLGTKLEVTNVKDYSMIELWDDRAIRVQFNQGTFC